MELQPTDEPVPLRLTVAAMILDAALRQRAAGIDMADPKNSSSHELARRVADQTGITREQALDLIDALGANLSSLIFEARLMREAGIAPQRASGNPEQVERQEHQPSGSPPMD